MTFLGLLLLCGLSAGLVARRKGNGFLLWFLVGFCLPLIGTLIAALYRSEADSPRRACPVCGRVLPIHDQVCMSCGTDLDFPEEVVGTLQEPPGAPQTLR